MMKHDHKTLIGFWQNFLAVIMTWLKDQFGMSFWSLMFYLCRFSL